MPLTTTEGRREGEKRGVEVERKGKGRWVEGELEKDKRVMERSNTRRGAVYHGKTK